MARQVKFLIRIKLLFALITIASTGLIVSFGSSMAQISGFDLGPFERSLSVDVSLRQANQSGKIAGKEFTDLDVINAFYQARQHKSYWIDQNRAGEFLNILEQAWQHGLNPESYHVTALRSLMNEEEGRAGAELLLTDAYIRYARDLSGVRVGTKGLSTDQNSLRQMISIEEALTHLDQQKNVAGLVKIIEPQNRTYKRLQQELIALSAEQEHDYASILPLKFKRKYLRPGMQDKRMPDLRLRLGVHPPKDKSIYFYDDRLAAAVIHFQRQHNLKPDGIIGPNTLAALNRTKYDKMAQLIANMERLRWAEEKRPEKYVVVNVASARLWAIDQGRVEFEMPVIAGSSKRPTETFVTKIKGVRYNPTWTIPPTIKRHDILPKLQENEDYLGDKGIELLTYQDGSMQTVDPDAYDWEDMSWHELSQLQMVQMPGDHNPLGRVRILMPNKHHIYLHDTNQPSMFDQGKTHASSGCIRLRDPHKMAEFILRDKNGWKSSRAKKILQSNATKDILVEDGIPVYVLYATAWINDKNQVVYGDDVYKEDQKLLRKLANIDGFVIPGHNENSTATESLSKLASIQ